MTVRLIIFSYLEITAKFVRTGRLFLRLGIMLSMQITKTIESCTQCNNCNKVTNGKHMTSSPFQDFPEGIKSM